MLRARLDELENNAHAGEAETHVNDSLMRKVAEEKAKVDEQLSDAELEQMRVDYLQSTAIVKRLMKKSQEGEHADEADFEDLFEEIANVAKPVASLLNSKRGIMQSVDWHICLLLMADLKPKAIKILVDCSSSKLSMRTRISEKLFPGKVLSGANEFDTMLRTWRGEQFD